MLNKKFFQLWLLKAVSVLNCKSSADNTRYYTPSPSERLAFSVAGPTMWIVELTEETFTLSCPHQL